MKRWCELEASHPELANAGRALIYQFKVGPWLSGDAAQGRRAACSPGVSGARGRWPLRLHRQSLAEGS